jgi:hemolysin activation/secretion protein
MVGTATFDKSPFVATVLTIVSVITMMPMAAVAKDMPNETAQKDSGRSGAAAVNAGAVAAKDSPAEGVAAKDVAATDSVAKNKPLQRFDIDEYRVDGSAQLPQIDIEEAVYPFLGPGKTSEDVEKARAALEKAYASKGYQTVSVSVPQQKAQRGVVVLKVSEMRVGRLRVKNSRYFDVDKIKSGAPSIAEGQLPNFNTVTKDIVALNQWPDRKVTPVLRAGVTPGTVDVDLNVEDKIPLHGSVELNNRQSPNTTALRLSSTVHYDNLWQRGDSISATYLVAPQRPNDAEVFSGSYLAKTNIDWLSVLVYGVNSKSDIATVGSQNVVGPGYVIGSRAVMTLPARENFFHSISIGADYKRFAEIINLGGVQVFSTPVGYVPMIANYSATWQRDGGLTQLNAGLTAGLRGIGSDAFDFDQKRFKATQNFFYFRGDVSDTEDFKGGAQLFVKVQGQLADQPLVSSEEFTAGGVETVRGYLESETLGDTGVAATVELRTPSFPSWLASIAKDESPAVKKLNVVTDFRLFAFGDAGAVKTLQPLVEQQAVFYLASYGVGTRFKLFENVNGMVTFAMPVIAQTYSAANKPRVLFRISGDF